MSETKSTIVVSGYGRCGTSMVMQMLSAGGIECIGPFPAFEVDEVKHAVSESFIRLAAGRAVKVLDPHRVGLPGDVRVIWLGRNHEQQAMSQAKFIALMFGRVPNRTDRRAMVRNYVKDRLAVAKTLRGRPVLGLSFEEIIGNPLLAAAKMRQFLEPVASLDATKAASAVIPRSHRCMPGLEIELALIKRSARSPFATWSGPGPAVVGAATNGSQA